MVDFAEHAKVTISSYADPFVHRFTFEGTDFFADDKSVIERATRIFDGRVLMLLDSPSGLRCAGVHVDYSGEHGLSYCPGADTAKLSILKRVDVPAFEVADTSTLRRDDTDDLPVLDFQSVVEKKGGNRTDAGFMRLVNGFEFVGFVMGTEWVDSQFGPDRPVMDASQQPILVDGKPITKKMQEVFVLRGTGRQPSTDVIGQVVQCDGRVKVPVYERLKSALMSVLADEAKLTEQARAKDPKAPAKKIPISIRYRGKEADRASKKEGETGRRGVHVFEVREVEIAKAVKQR